jgi:RNA polymerase sigma-70 factor (ECF subfamily)
LSRANAATDLRAAEIAALRPELHRYAARLAGSVIDGEDVVQEATIKALAALGGLDAATPLRPWLFRIAHNCVLDLLRKRTVRQAEPIEAAAGLADPEAADALEDLMRREAVGTAVARFLELPAIQRSVVALKDVLDEPLAGIAEVSGLTVDAVKAHLARGRARLRAINAEAAAIAPAPAASPEANRYAALFNGHDWDGLRALLAEDVRLTQSAHPQRRGAADVGMFFSIYAEVGTVRLAPAWLEGREVLAVFEPGSDEPDYFMQLEWRDGRIAAIHDYRYVRYVMEGAALTVAGA